jgi:hypothetical protein
MMRGCGRVGKCPVEPRTDRDVVFVAMSVFVMIGLALTSAWAQAPQKTEVYFVQGQAMYYPDNLSRSQEEAIQDLTSSGVLQAVAGVLGPASTQSLFGVIQERVLSNKEKYVAGYQLASEGLAKGLYRVTGQVTVSKEILLQDLREYGFQVPPPAQSRVAEMLQDKAARNILRPPQNSEEGRDTREVAGAKPAVLWAVAENWEEKWDLPEDAAESETPRLAGNILEHSRNLDWTLRFAPVQSLQVDRLGNVQMEQALAVARGTGLAKAAIGKCWLDPSQPGNQKLLASLQIVDVSTGAAESEIAEERALEPRSLDEGIFYLAASIVPAIDRILSREREAEAKEGASQSGRRLESWTLTLRGSHPQSGWEIVRKEIEGLFKDAKTSGFEMGVDQITVQVEGMDGRSVRKALDGREISPGGPTVQIKDFSEDGRSMTVIFSNPGDTQ